MADVPPVDRSEPAPSVQAGGARAPELAARQWAESNARKAAPSGAPRRAQPSGTQGAGRASKAAPAARVVEARSEAAPEVGALLTSHGDIDRPAEELEAYTKTAVLKNGAMPVPQWSRPALARFGYPVMRGELESQYAATGPTHYREQSERQSAAVTAAMKKIGLPGKAYVGYNFTPPFIADSLDRMRRDGVKKVLLFNQGAQFSLATLGESIKEAKEYLDAHPEWKAEVYVVRQFSDDPRFRQMLARDIERDAKIAFPGQSASNVCVLIASHGLPLPLIEKGDPATRQMLAAVDELRDRLAPHPTHHGFMNDDFVPGVGWTEPDVVQTAENMRAEPCENVLLDARLSFTAHHRAPLYDANVEAREVLEREGPAPGRKPGPNERAKKVVLAPNFDDDPEFAALIADKAAEALQGKGDVQRIQ